MRRPPRSMLALLALTLAVPAVARDEPQPPGYTIPTLDLTGQADRQVVVDRQEGQYLGHPTTVLLEDGRTMLCVYPMGHGAGQIVLKRSEDGGRTWSDRLPTPENWATSQETPTIHRVVDADGKKRLILFSGLYPIKMAVSEDDGQTWSPLEPIGEFGGIVAMASVEPLRTGPGHYLALFHDDGRFLKGGPNRHRTSPAGEAKGTWTVFKCLSTNGGLTWSEPEPIAVSDSLDLCEPGLVRSPDGKRIAVILRENSRKRNSYLIVSDDEGKTWSPPRELPGALTGDRHVGKYAPDGRLVLSFRDTTRESPTAGDWVAWVGTFDDLIEGREGQYRVRLMDNTRGSDCAYPGVEILPDGTFVCTTYGHWEQRQSPYIVSVRFTLDELDAMAAPGRNQADAEIDRPRVVVLTDISSLRAGEREPDDGQSMIRLMLYANEFEIEGLIASSNLGHGQRTRPELIHEVIDAYARVQPNLVRHDPRYPEVDALRAVVRAGRPIADRDVAVEDSVGEGLETDASRHLIEVLERPDPRPVWVLIWGGSADLAQALHSARAGRSAEDFARLAAKLRVYAIGDQDSTGPWIREEFPEVHYRLARRCYRGMYRAGDTALAGSDWVRANIHGHGALGDLYPDYRGGDIFGATLGPVRGIKEGDTPSFLHLVPNGLNRPERPELGGWGGRFEPEGSFLTDVPDGDLDTSGDPDPRMSSVYRWRPDFQADFAARLDWCLSEPSAANHPPEVRLAGPFERQVRPGEEVALDASATTDPDGDALSFRWSFYPADGPTGTIEGADQAEARFVVPDDATAGTSFPLLLTVRDAGEPALTRYARVLVEVRE